jgi:hypothetical protein
MRFSRLLILAASPSGGGAGLPFGLVVGAGVPLGHVLVDRLHGIAAHVAGGVGGELELLGAHQPADGAAALHGVGHLVGDDLPAEVGVGRVGALAEEDVLAGGERRGVDPSRERVGGAVGVHAHAAEAGAEAPLEVAADAARQG